MSKRWEDLSSEHKDFVWNKLRTARLEYEGLRDTFLEVQCTNDVVDDVIKREDLKDRDVYLDEVYYQVLSIADQLVNVLFTLQADPD